MHTTHNHIVMTTACATAASRDGIIDALLHHKLAACVQVSPIESHYTWKGKREHTHEFLLTIKTRLDLAPRVAATILEHHPYETPEILSYPVATGHVPYLRWIDEVTEHHA